MPDSGHNSANLIPSLPGDQRERAQRQLLHQLNNIFASIHSSLDLALANANRPEGRTFLAKAQEGARRGARLVNELRFGDREAAPADPALLGLESQPAQADCNPHAHAHASEAHLEGSERILVAEDEESIRMLIRAVLSYRGYEVIEATDGDEAVRIYRDKGPIDLVILDWRMQKLDGPPALAQIRQLNPHVPALALSGLPFERQGLDDGSGQDGFNGRLNKPFNNSDLVRMVRDLLDGRRAA